MKNPYNAFFKESQGMISVGIIPAALVKTPQTKTLRTNTEVVVLQLVLVQRLLASSDKLVVTLHPGDPDHSSTTIVGSASKHEPLVAKNDPPRPGK